MARAPFKAASGGGGGKRALQRLIKYWPLVPCLAVLLWGYADYRWAPFVPCRTLLWLSIPRCFVAASRPWASCIQLLPETVGNWDSGDKM